MNYHAIYNRLMERARTRELRGYCESHHIIPRCLGGGDATTNTVRLTPEEHYLAHQLLVKMHPHNGKLIWAAIAMTGAGRSELRIGNKLYGWLRRRFSEGQLGRPYSPETRAKIGEKSKQRNQGALHPMFGRKHSPDTIAKLSRARKGCVSSRKGAILSQETKNKIAEAQKRHQANHPNPFTGKKHSDETRAKMRAAQQKRLADARNSIYNDGHRG